MTSLQKLILATLFTLTLLAVSGCGEKKDITGDTGENEKYKNELTK